MAHSQAMSEFKTTMLYNLKKEHIQKLSSKYGTSSSPNQDTSSQTAVSPV